MHRRTFLAGTVLGTAALTIVLPARASAALVTSLKELQSAIDRPGPGARVVVANGTYTVPSSGIRVSGKHGTTSAPITITAESRGGVVLKGERGFVFDASSNVTVSGFAFRQSTSLDIPGSYQRVRLTRNDFQLADLIKLYWVVVRGDDTKIDRNHFHHKTTSGIFIVVDGLDEATMAQRLHVFRNHFSDHSFSGLNGGEAIRLGVSSRALASANAVVEYNLFERCDGDPEAVSVKSSDNTIRYNTIRDSRGGIVLRDGNRSTVDGNYLIAGADGVRVYGNDHLIVNNYLSGLSDDALVIGSGSTRDHHPGESEDERRGHDACDRAMIAHNTLLNNRCTLSSDGKPHEPRDVVVADNLLVGDVGSLVAVPKSTGFTWQSNILWGAASNGTVPAGGYTRVDPRLLKASDGIHRLAAGSPAIGAATLRSPAVAEDIDGHPRGDKRDVGADEYATAAPVRGSLTPTDVCPNAA